MKNIYFILLLIIFTLVDCRCERPDLVASKVVFEIPENLLKFAEQKNVDIKNILGSALDSDGHIKVDLKNNLAGVLKISLILSRVEDELMLVGHLVRGSEEHMAFSDLALSKITNLDAKTLKQALVPAVAYLRQQLTSSKIPSDAYFAKLRQAALGEELAPELLTSAIKAAGAKKDKEALSLLTKILLKSDNLGVANACLMALAKLQDSKALEAIIEFAEHKPAVIRRQAILAVRQMPCQQSAEWLLVMAYGHEDPVVRQEALAALGSVEAQLGERK